MQEERRQFERYPVPEDRQTLNLRIGWAREAGFDPDDLVCVDVSRAGLGLLSDNSFAVGDTLKLLVGLGDAEPVQLIAIVCNRRQLEANELPAQVALRDYRYGVYFEYDVAPGDDRAEQLLLLLEEEVRRLYYQPV